MTATLFTAGVRGFRDSFSAIDRAQNITSVVFIDAAVEDYQSLIAGVVGGVEAIVLDAQRDGVEQIAEILSDRTNINAVHIVSHGSPGSVRLGNTELSTFTLQAYAPLLQKWRDSLAPGAAILLYGCKVGANANFLQNLRELTGANIAASKNLTGSAASGGDWNLEVTAGAIDR